MVQLIRESAFPERMRAALNHANAGSKKLQQELDAARADNARLMDQLKVAMERNAYFERQIAELQGEARKSAAEFGRCENLMSEQLDRNMRLQTQCEGLQT